MRFLLLSVLTAVAAAGDAPVLDVHSLPAVDMPTDFAVPPAHAHRSASPTVAPVDVETVVTVEIVSLRPSAPPLMDTQEVASLAGLLRQQYGAQLHAVGVACASDLHSLCGMKMHKGGKGGKGGKGKRHRPAGGKGKGKGGKGDGTDGRDYRDNKRRKDADGYHLNDYVLTNATMEDYYRTVWPAEEFDEILACLKTVLPTTFRIGPKHAQVRDQLENKWIPLLVKTSLMSETGEEKLIEKPSPLDWYPDRMAWHMEISKREMKKNPKLKEFHTWLSRETESGHISRQEAVSMIPVFFLDIEPHHKILDMCAAPGMKTTQLLENLTIGEEEPTGVVVANDADRNRAFLLAHTLKRLRTPAFMVVHHDARHIPTLRETTGDKAEILFDRILCDVPCSGDGTLRKSPDAWEKWTPAGGLNLHKTQVGIAMRGASLLKVGGTMVYSTCSFNPVENEAGVAELLRLANGCLEILDVSERLPGLKRAEGMHSWTILGKDKVQYAKFEDCEDPKAAGILPSMFPPTAEVATEMHLERCMRLIPSHQNTGGFFITILRKTKAFNMNPTKVQMLQAKAPLGVTPAGAAAQDLADFKAEAAEEPAEPVERSEEPCQIFAKHGKCKYEARCKFTHVESGELKMKSSVEGEEPLTQVVETHPEVVAKLQEAFGLKNFSMKQLFSRSTSTAKMPRNISYVSESITDMIECDPRSRLSIINCGVKAFERVELKDPAVIAPYRVNQDFTDAILPKMKLRKVKCGIRCFQNLLAKNNIPLNRIASVDTDSKHPLSEGLEALSIGTIVIYAKHEGELFTASAFKGKENLQLYIGKDEIEVYKSQLLESIGAPVLPEGAEGEAEKEKTVAAVDVTMAEPKAAEHVKF